MRTTAAAVVSPCDPLRPSHSTGTVNTHARPTTATPTHSRPRPSVTGLTGPPPHGRRPSRYRQFDESQDGGVLLVVQPERAGSAFREVSPVQPVLALGPRAQQLPGVVREDVQRGRHLGPGGPQLQGLPHSAAVLVRDAPADGLPQRETGEGVGGRAALQRVRVVGGEAVVHEPVVVLDALLHQPGQGGERGTSPGWRISSRSPRAWSVVVMWVSSWWWAVLRAGTRPGPVTGRSRRGEFRTRSTSSMYRARTREPSTHPPARAISSGSCPAARAAVAKPRRRSARTSHRRVAATARRSTTSAAASAVIRPVGSPMVRPPRVIGGAMRSHRSTRTNSGPSVRPAASRAAR